MPTFERCSSCLAQGISPEDVPLVPEGRKCDACEPFALTPTHPKMRRDRQLQDAAEKYMRDRWTDASNADHKCVACGAPVTWAWSKCWGCVRRALNAKHGKGAK